MNDIHNNVNEDKNDTNESVINSNYLKMWFNRVDFDRYTRYHSWGSAREMFNYSDMERVKIPLPPIEVQVAIVSLYQCALEYKKIAAEADAQLRSICSALMQHAINS
jgi:type I restriction enzyme S subunit